MKLCNSKDLTNSENFALKCICYGSPGSGKTKFGSTFPNPHYIDTDKGMLTLRDMNIPYYSFDGDNAMQAYNNIKVAIDKMIKDKSCKTIVIDSLTTLSDVILESVLMQDGNAGKSPEFKHWNSQMNALKEILRLCLGSGKHFLATAHEKIDKDENTGRVWILPALTGQLSHKIGLYFDEVYHSECIEKINKPTDYKLLARASSLYVAKSRLRSKDAGTHYKPDFNCILKEGGVLINSNDSKAY